MAARLVSLGSPLQKELAHQLQGVQFQDLSHLSMQGHDPFRQPHSMTDPGSRPEQTLSA